SQPLGDICAHPGRHTHSPNTSPSTNRMSLPLSTLLGIYHACQVFNRGRDSTRSGATTFGTASIPGVMPYTRRAERIISRSATVFRSDLVADYSARPLRGWFNHGLPCWPRQEI